MKTVCMCCEKTIKDGAGEVSHGICPECAVAWLRGDLPAKAKKPDPVGENCARKAVEA